MSVGTVYVRAITEAVVELGKSNGNGHKEHQRQILEDIRKQLSAFLNIVNGNPSLSKALCTLATSREEKSKVVAALLKGQEISPLAVKLINLLVRKNRLGELGSILEAFDQSLLESDGGVLGLAESAEPLNEESLRALSASFGKKLGKRVEFKNTSDASLLAGLRVTVAGVTYDGTLRGQLDRLKEKFLSK